MSIKKWLSGLLGSFLVVLSVFILSPVNVYTTSNVTEKISVYVTESDETLTLEYYILQQFNEASRGVFISLPKNQGGVWSNYEVKSVKRTSLIEEGLGSNVLQVLDDQEYLDEPYDEITDWDQLRMRVGKPDRWLSNGLYEYYIKIEASKNSDLEYNFILLRDWVDTVNTIEVFENGANRCLETVQCTSDQTSISLNPGRPKPNVFHHLLSTFWMYILMLGVVGIILYGIWYQFARELHPPRFRNRPEFHPPQDLLPWQAQYLITDGSVDVKNILLSYLLWLNYEKYIFWQKKSRAETSESVDEDALSIEIVKELPNDMLPNIYNTAVTMGAEMGLKEGILASKLNQEMHMAPTHSFIIKSLKKYYSQKPIFQGWAYVLVGAFVVLILGVVAFNTLQAVLLIGNSFIPPLLVSFVALVVGLMWVLSVWARLTKEGRELADFTARYKYYLDKAEKYKLDFQNNPEDGIQRYLESVPFAAAFGILPRFQKMMQDIFPQSRELDNTSILQTGYHSIVFYTPPSSSSSSGGVSSGGGGFSGGGGSW